MMVVVDAERARRSMSHLRRLADIEPTLHSFTLGNRSWH